MDIVRITTAEGTFYVTSRDLSAQTSHLTAVQLIVYALNYFTAKYNDQDVESVEIIAR